MKWFLLALILAGAVSAFVLYGKLRHLGQSPEKDRELIEAAPKGAVVGTGKPKAAAPLETPDLQPAEDSVFNVAVPLSSLTSAELMLALGGASLREGVTCYPSPFGNGVVITGTNFQHVTATAEMVKMLDREKPEMVMVQAVVLRTSSGNGSAVGIWTTLQDVVSGGGFGLGKMSFNPALGVLTFGSVTAAQEVVRLLGSNDVSRYGFLVESRPVVAAVSGQEAWFTSGREIPITTTTQAIANSQTSVTFKKVQFSFGVRPSVMPSGRVALSITQTNDDVIGSTVVGGNSVPTIATQSLTTRIELVEGQVAILGGMQVSNSGDSSSGFPILGAVPPFSWVFGNRKKVADKSELVVAITLYRVREGANPMPVRKAESAAKTRRGSCSTKL